MNSNCIYTMVSGDYQAYIPLFVDRCTKEYPEYDVRILLRDTLTLPEEYDIGIVTDEYGLGLYREYPRDGTATSCLRFLVGDEYLKEYDCVYITDIDILIQRETPDLFKQHLADIVKNDLFCYSNYVSEKGLKMPAVFMVTKDWWDATKKARAKYAKTVKEGEANCWGIDEQILYKVVVESGLQLQEKTANLWNEHGIHLGRWRKYIEKKYMDFPPIPGDQTIYIEKLLKDDNFMDILKEMSGRLPILEKIFKVFRDR